MKLFEKLFVILIAPLFLILFIVNIINSPFRFVRGAIKKIYNHKKTTKH